MSLTIVIPTLGRPTLARTVFSFLHQLADGDEVILVADPKGDIDYVRFMHEGVLSKRNGVNSRTAVCSQPGGWGHPQRNHGHTSASGSRVWCLADDDIATPGALAALRAATTDPWTIFRAGRGSDTPWVWQDEKIRVGNLDADCILAPPRTRSRWGLDYEGDIVFARALANELGPPVFRPDVVAVTQPGDEYLARHYAALAGS